MYFSLDFSLKSQLITFLSKPDWIRMVHEIFFFQKCGFCIIWRKMHVLKTNLNATLWSDIREELLSQNVMNWLVFLVFVFVQRTKYLYNFIFCFVFVQYLDFSSIQDSKSFSEPSSFKADSSQHLNQTTRTSSQLAQFSSKKQSHFLYCWLAGWQIQQQQQKQYPHRREKPTSQCFVLLQHFFCVVAFFFGATKSTVITKLPSDGKKSIDGAICACSPFPSGCV